MNRVNKVVRARAPTVNAGKKRKCYTAKYKAEVIHASEEQGLTVRAVALRYNLDLSMVVRWIKRKTSIIDDAASSHRHLLTKGRRAK